MISELPRTWRLAHPAMGTVVSISFSSAGHDDRTARALIAGACRHIDEVERTFTTWEAGSPLCAYRAGRPVEVGTVDLVEHVLERCAELRDLTGGWFDPWSLPGGLDPSGYVKGWAAGGALAILRGAGPIGASVGAGGDFATCGRPPDGARWRIGITHPWRPDALAGVVAVDAAIATSGNYARAGQLYDPFTGRLCEDIPSATVTGPDPGVADAFATALAVGGLAAAPYVDAVPGYEYHLIGAAGDEHTSAGMLFVDPVFVDPVLVEPASVDPVAPVSASGV